MNDRCGCVVYTLKYGDMRNTCNITDSLTGMLYVDASAELSGVPNLKEPNRGILSYFGHVQNYL